ncbi:ArsR/SmtB family transcription factor [Rhodovibrionaceae bacterium A322]
MSMLGPGVISTIVEKMLDLSGSNVNSMNMEMKQAARCLEKLGNPTRLSIYRLLVQAGDEGLPVGAVQNNLEVPASTLSHHISHLVNSGLVTQTRQGRVLRCTANYDLMRSLVDFLSEQCCVGAETALTERIAS